MPIAHQFRLVPDIFQWLLVQLNEFLFQVWVIFIFDLVPYLYDFRVVFLFSVDDQLLKRKKDLNFLLVNFGL